MLAIAVAAVVVVVLIAIVPAIATALGVIVVFGSIIVFGWGAVGLAVPHKVGLPDRGSAVGAWIVSVVMFVVGGLLLPDRPEDPAPTAADLEQGPVPPREERERAAAEVAREAGVSNRVYPGVESARRIATDLIADMGLEAGPLDAISDEATFTDFHWAGFSSAGGLSALLRGSDPSLAHLLWHETDGVVRFRAKTAEEVAEEAAAREAEAEAEAERRLTALDRMEVALDRANAVQAEINRKCADPTGQSYAALVVYVKCVAGFLVTLCPEIGEGPLVDMSNAARDMDAPVAASLLNQASLDCWTAVYWADTPNGGMLPRFVGEAVTRMGENLSQASARLH